VSQIKANEKILKVTIFGLRKLKPFFNIKQFIASRVNLTPASRRRVNQLSQYASSPGHRAYCYAGLAVFFPSGSHNSR